MRRYLIFSVVGLTLFMASVAGTTVSVAFPTIISELNASLALSGWVLSVYQLVAIGAMPLIARMSDVLGRKRIFVMCTLLFIAGSALSAFAPNVILLILARALQAIGGGGFLPSATGIVSEEFPETRQRTIGLISSIFPIGAIVGPNLGGWMVASLGWRSVFWFNIPVGVAVLLFSGLLLRTDHGGKAKIDFIGAGLLIGSLSTLMLTLTQVGNGKSDVPWILAGLFFVLSIAILSIFLWWERRVSEPIINLELLRERPFLAANVYNLIYGACAFGIFSLIPLYAVSVYSLSTLESGLILTPRSIGMMVASAVTSFSLVKWGYRWPILIGTLTVALGLFLLALELHGFITGGFSITPMFLLLSVMSVSGVGVGISAPAANNACIELMPDQVATITGLRGMFRNMGGAISIAIATLILESINDVNHAFFIIFTSLALILLLSIPAIFIMPGSPSTKPPPPESSKK
jgi:EmrB/QacA subfamily drug resistance transporter